MLIIKDKVMMLIRDKIEMIKYHICPRLNRKDRRTVMYMDHNKLEVRINDLKVLNIILLKKVG